MENPSFRIYYDGGETYDGDPYYAPAFGVLAIVQIDKAHGHRIVVFSDYFVWRDGEWVGVDHIGMIDYLQQLGPRRVLFGRLVDKEYFYKVVRTAEDDPDFPERTGMYKEEKVLGV